jgi:S1-C subfamily serine protease
MKKWFVLLFGLFIVIGNFSHVVASSKEPRIFSFADIVEPLMPAVVNIYTVKYNKKSLTKDSHLRELIPFEEFSDFF